jgi:hypothetical protein
VTAGTRFEDGLKWRCLAGGDSDRRSTGSDQPGELVAAGWEVTSADALFDAMARLDHPDREAVLTMIGRRCDDKKTAKAARKATSFVASRRG